MAHTVLLFYLLSDHTILHINQGAIYSSFAELSVSNRPLTVAASVEEEGASFTTIYKMALVRFPSFIHGVSDQPNVLKFGILGRRRFLLPFHQHISPLFDYGERSAESYRNARLQFPYSKIGQIM